MDSANHSSFCVCMDANLIWICKKDSPKTVLFSKISTLLRLTLNHSCRFSTKWFKSLYNERLVRCFIALNSIEKDSVLRNLIVSCITSLLLMGCINYHGMTHHFAPLNPAD